jgi:hypothetical protein
VVDHPAGRRHPSEEEVQLLTLLLCQARQEQLHPVCQGLVFSHVCPGTFLTCSLI